MADTLQDLAARLIDLRGEKDALSAQLKACNESIETVQLQLLDTMVAQEIEKFSAHGCMFYPTTKRHVSVAAGQMDALCKWLDANGHEGMAKKSVHSQTLGAFVREHMEEFGTLPESLDPLVSVFEKTQVSVRRG